MTFPAPTLPEAATRRRPDRRPGAGAGPRARLPLPGRGDTAALWSALARLGASATSPSPGRSSRTSTPSRSWTEAGGRPAARRRRRAPGASSPPRARARRLSATPRRRRLASLHRDASPGARSPACSPTRWSRAWIGEDSARLFAVDLRQPGVTVQAGDRGLAARADATSTRGPVDFDRRARRRRSATAAGTSPRPGFAWGGIGVAAVLVRRRRRRRPPAAGAAAASRPPDQVGAHAPRRGRRRLTRPRARARPRRPRPSTPAGRRRRRARCSPLRVRAGRRAARPRTCSTAPATRSAGSAAPPTREHAAPGRRPAASTCASTTPSATRPPSAQDCSRDPGGRRVVTPASTHDRRRHTRRRRGPGALAWRRGPGADAAGRCPPRCSSWPRHPDDETPRRRRRWSPALAASPAGRSSWWSPPTGEGSHPDSPTHSHPDRARGPPRAARRTTALARLAPASACTTSACPTAGVATREDELVDRASSTSSATDGAQHPAPAHPGASDGHTDHERRRPRPPRSAAHRTDAQLLEYPVWLVALGRLPADLPWARAAAGSTSTEDERRRKADAIAAHTSQVRPLSDRPARRRRADPRPARATSDRSRRGLPRGRARLPRRRPFEDLHTRARPTRGRSTTAGTSAASARSCSARCPTPATRPPSRSAARSGRSPSDLAARCGQRHRGRPEQPRPWRGPRHRLVGFDWVTVERRTVPRRAARGPVRPRRALGGRLLPQPARARTETIAALESTRRHGAVVACHWLHPVRGWPLDGGAVTARLREAWGAPVVQHLERDFLLESGRGPHDPHAHRAERRPPGPQRGRTARRLPDLDQRRDRGVHREPRQPPGRRGHRPGLLHRRLGRGDRPASRHPQRAGARGQRRAGPQRRGAEARTVLGRGSSPGGLHWVAITDADTRVPPHWLAPQVRLAAEGADVVVGTVEPDPTNSTTSRSATGVPVTTCVRTTPHVHGANLGFTLEAYDRVGGFPGSPLHQTSSSSAGQDAGPADAGHRPAPGDHLDPTDRTHAGRLRCLPSRAGLTGGVDHRRQHRPREVDPRGRCAARRSRR